MSIVYVNGEFCEAEKASISVFDRGFTFGDSVYEVIPVYNSKVRFLKRHLTRLNNSLNKARIPQPKIDWESIFNRLVTLNGGGNIQIYLQVTRGNQGVRKHDIPSPPITPTVVAYTLHNPYPIYEEQIKGLKATLVEDIRWLRCDIKTTAMLGNVLVNDDAIQDLTNTAILYRDGIVTEGSASNVFIVDKNNVILTPPLDHLCLPGITRELVIDILKNHGLNFKETTFSPQNLLDAHEVWITSTTKEIYPVTTVDKHPIGHGKAGPVWENVNQKFKDYIQAQYE